MVLNAVEQKLYKGLRSFRFKASEKENIPAYMVFRDTELKNIAIQQPKTKEELLNIKGIAIKKYEKYGKEVLKIVDKFRD
ncbi:ATP-dependent DNA helicase RecQ [subsurface metagenome]